MILAEKNFWPDMQVHLIDRHLWRDMQVHLTYTCGETCRLT